eukprot:g68937.t1
MQEPVQQEPVLQETTSGSPGATVPPHCQPCLRGERQYFCDCPSWAQLTEHEELFSESYWGSFRARPGHVPPVSVIAAHNRLVREYGLRRLVQPLLPLAFRAGSDHEADKGMDHLEVYRGATHYVGIVSNYLGESKPPAGWQPTRQLYSEHCKSYLRVVPVPTARIGLAGAGAPAPRL